MKRSLVASLMLAAVVFAFSPASAHNAPANLTMVVRSATVAASPSGASTVELTAKLVDADGLPVAGYDVTFEITTVGSGIGGIAILSPRLSQTRVTTGEDGTASTFYSAGSKRGTDKVGVFLAELGAGSLNAQGNPDAAARAAATTTIVVKAQTCATPGAPCA